MTKRVAVIGAGGYTGIELLRVLRRHPGVEVVACVSPRMAGRSVRDLDPDAPLHETFSAETFAEVAARGPDLVYVATPDGVARENVADLGDVPWVDLSADHRFAEGARYCLPELHRPLPAGTRHVANPGCYATAAILGALPPAENAWVRHVVIDGKSGYSGGGREPKAWNLPELLEENVIAYRLTGHKHEREMERWVGAPISFTAHVVPAFRGLLCTLHVFLSKDVSSKELFEAAAERYANEPFVRIEEAVPTLHDVRGTNLCRIGGFEVDRHGRAVIVAALDNLRKGAATQAVQNGNLLLGLPETEGLLE